MEMQGHLGLTSFGVPEGICSSCLQHGWCDMNDFHFWLIVFFIKNSKNFTPIQCCKGINISWSEQLSKLVTADTSASLGEHAGWKD